jgi:CDP-glucose 4,6-dehydratase
MDRQFWKNKNIFITGHTGFKGSWLSVWLNELGANVTGYSLSKPTDPSMFETLSLEKKVNTVFGDIRDYDKLKAQIIMAKPDIVIHMAAQALVLESYNNPIDTYETNLMGTVNIMNAMRDVPSIKAFINVTSDKCYENKENFISFKEGDALGGIDPYSSSKACAELITSAYRHSFYKDTVAIATARAGNVIGGGDWALNRVIPDFIKKINQHQKLTIRNPNSIRPWQFVLEPLSGYLKLAEKLFSEGPAFSESWNFGPESEDGKSVEWLISKFDKEYGGGGNFEIESKNNHPYEANYLNLDCSKSIRRLNWAPKLTIEQSISMTCAWYKNFYENNLDMYRFSVDQINQFELI